MTPRAVLGVALRVLSVAFLVGAVALTGVAIIALALAVGFGTPSWGGVLLVFLLVSVAPVIAAIAVWKAAGRIIRGDKSAVP